MSAHYLVDLFANPFSSARLLDVRSPANGQTSLGGALVIRVPDSVQVNRPANLTDLLTKKYQGLLAGFASFTHQAYDDLLDASGLDLTHTGTKGSFGDRGHVVVGVGGVVQTVAITLTSPAFAQCAITWETYTLTMSDDRTNVAEQVYTEVASTPSLMTCEVSVNGGTTWTTAYDGVVLSIPAGAQGLSLLVRFTNVSNTRLGLGSWAFVY